MKVTTHATQRFLERVLHKVRYSHDEFLAARQELEEIFRSVIPGSYGRPFALPRYKGYRVIHRDNTILTIIEKNRSHA